MVAFQKRGLFYYIPEKLAQNKLGSENLYWITDSVKSHQTMAISSSCVSKGNLKIPQIIEKSLY